jgi:hypothetical protein
MSWSYNFGANPTIDFPRLMIADTDAAHPIFQDEEIRMAYQIDQAYCFEPAQNLAPRTYGTPSYRRIAATLLDALAANKARLSAALEVLDIKVQAGDAAKALRQAAMDYRQTEMDSGTFAITEQYNSEFAGRERIWKQLLRLVQGA